MFTDTIRSLTHRLSSLLRREHSAENLSEELRYHIERQTEENIARGMSPEEARRAAQMEFGSLPEATEATTRANGFGWFNDFSQDIRYGLRSLRKSPGFTCVTVATLAIGIGACTAIFSLVNAVLLRALPYGEASRLVYLFTPVRSMHLPDEIFAPTFNELAALRKQTTSYTGMTAFRSASFNLTASRISERMKAARVDETFFSTLEAPPELGRAIQTEDIRTNNRVVLISHALWLSMFGGSYEVLTKSLSLDGTSYRIIGVMPSEFHYPDANELTYDNAPIKGTGLWVPLVLTAEEKTSDESPDDILARLKPGVSIAQAEAEFKTIFSRLDPLRPPFFRGGTTRIETLNQLSTGSIRPLMWLFLGAVFLVLLIACSNAANLLLARAASRTHELGVRATLGASRSRMIRQLLAESLMLSLASGLLGTALAYVFLHALLRLNPGNIPRLQEATLDLRVLLFTLTLSIVTSLLFGLLPAFAASRVNLIAFLKSNGNRGIAGGNNRLRSSLIISEVALAVVLLAGSGLLLRSYLKLYSQNLGFSSSTVTMHLQLDERYNNPETRRTLIKDLIDKLNTTPGTIAAGAINYLPLSNSESVGTFTVDGYANQPNQIVESRTVTPAYFSAMQTPLLEGRFFQDNDRDKAPPVVIVNEAFAKTYLGGRYPIGIKTSKGKVIGIVGDVKHASLEEAPQPQLFTSFWQGDEDRASIAIRSSLPGQTVAAEARDTLKSIDPTLAFSDIQTMSDLITKSNAKRIFQTSIITAFSVIALLLALIGIYGLLSYSVKQRTPEIGIRLALGSTREHIIAMVLKQGLKLVLFGSALGLAAAFALTRLLTSYLFEVKALDPITFIAVPLVLLLAAVAACLIPGWLAARTDPIQALRYE